MWGLNIWHQVHTFIFSITDETSYEITKTSCKFEIEYRTQHPLGIHLTPQLRLNEVYKRYNLGGVMK